jgi:hypothetical protein
MVSPDPIETISCGYPWKMASPAFEYGLSRKSFKDFPNIIWMHGNDPQSWRNAADDDLVEAVARDQKHRCKTHPYSRAQPVISGSLKDKSWHPLSSNVYTYFPTYAQVLTEYTERTSSRLHGGANYEFENVGPDTDGGSAQNL